MPYKLYDSAMAESPDGRGVLLFGGCNGNEMLHCEKENRILELRAESNSWNILNITLENPRINHVVIPLQ